VLMKQFGGMGWERDLPDFRDYLVGEGEVDAVLGKSKLLKAVKRAMPSLVDLREWCSPIENQENIGSCTAHAGVGLIEYFERRAFGRHLDASRLFLYKVTRNLLGVKGDTGAYLRTTMKAMVKFGVPPEKYWPYDTRRFDEEPPKDCYAYAQDFQALKYYRLESRRGSTAQTLKHVRKVIAAGLPVMFGFGVFSSMPGLGERSGDIPYPRPEDKLEGGHAVAAVGYDDNRRIGDLVGALLIRNSWSASWGEFGYGWLPYAYVLDGLAVDFWSLVRTEFADSELFRSLK